MELRRVSFLSGILTLLFLAGCLGGTPFSTGDHSGLATKQPPTKPTALNNSTAVKYAKHYETTRVYNATAKAFQGSKHTNISISPSVQARLLRRTSAGYFVETVSRVSTRSSDSGSQVVGDPGIPNTSVYFVSKDRITRIATPSPYPSNQTNLVVISNFDSRPYKTTARIRSEATNSLIERNQSTIRSNTGVSVGNISASKTPAHVELTIGGQQVTTGLPRTKTAESLWKPIGIVVLIGPDHTISVSRFYSTAG